MKGSLDEKVVSITIALVLIASVLAPIGITGLFAINTSTWSAPVVALFGLIAVFTVLGVAMAIYKHTVKIKK